MSRWGLADIIDLEAQLAWDRVQAHHQGGVAAGLDQRDRQIGAELEGADDPTLLRGWVQRLRERHDRLPGHRLLTAFGLLRAIASLLAIALGVALAAAVLRYDGSRPIPILAAVGILALLPAAFLVVTLLLQLPGPIPFARTGGPMQWLLAHAAAPWLRRALPQGPPGYHAALVANLTRRADGRPVYGRLWRAILGELVQQLGLLTVGAALLAIVLRVVFTDLAFGWGSTLAVDEAWMRRWVDVLATPWGWLWPAGVPDDQLIAISRYNRLEDSFGGAAGVERAMDAAALGRWWTFLVGCVATWALLPRLLVWAGFARARRRAVEAQDRRSATLLDHAEQIQRLRDAGPRFRAGPGDAEPAPPPPADDDAWPDAGPALVVVWDEAAAADHARAVVEREGGAVAHILTAGHGVDVAIDEAAIAAVDADEPGPIALLVAGDEQPLAEVLAFLRDLRHAGGNRPLRVVLLGGNALNRDRWQSAIADLDAGVLRWEDQA